MSYLDQGIEKWLHTSFPYQRKNKKVILFPTCGSSNIIMSFLFRMLHPLAENKATGEIAVCAYSFYYYSVLFCVYRMKLFHFHSMLRQYDLLFTRRTWSALRYVLWHLMFIMVSFCYSVSVQFPLSSFLLIPLYDYVLAKMFNI